MTGNLQVVTRPANDNPPGGRDPSPFSESGDAELLRFRLGNMVGSERFNVADDNKMELETLLKLNGALQRALKDSDTELLSTMHGALIEQRRLRERLKEVLKETSLKKAESSDTKSEAGEKFASPATEKVLALKKRTEELTLRIQLMEMKERTAEEQAKVLEAQIEAAGREKLPTQEPSLEKETTEAADEDMDQETSRPATTKEFTPEVAVEEPSEAEVEAERERKLEEERQRVLEQSQAATHKLLELRSQNQQLRHELKWARKVLSNEVGDPATVTAAMEAVAGNGGQWRGRSEQMSVLQHRLSELQDQLQNVQQECAQMEKRRRELVRDAPADGDPLPDEIGPPDAASVPETAPSVCSGGDGLSAGGGGVWGAASAAAQERRRAAEGDEREARAAQRAADAQAEAYRQHNAAAEAGIRAARDRVAHLTAKAAHDKQLAQAVAEQIRAAEAQVKQRDHQREATHERFLAERQSLEQQLVRTKSVASHLKIVQEEKKKILEGLSGSMGSRDSGRSFGRQAMGRGSAGSQKEDFARMALLRRVLQGKEEERGRLQRLVDHLSARLAEMVREAAMAKDTLRRERQRTAALETEIGRMELQRPGGIVNGNDLRRAALEHGDFRGRANQLTEENTALRGRLERLLRERENEIRTYAGIFNQRGLLERLRRTPGWSHRPNTRESAWSAKPCMSDAVSCATRDGQVSPYGSTYGDL